MLPFFLSAFLLAAPDEPPPHVPSPSSSGAEGGRGAGRLPRGTSAHGEPLEGASALLTARVGAFRDTLYVALEVDDEAITDRDRVSLALHFPEAGVTAAGRSSASAPAARWTRAPEDGVSPGILALVDAAVHRTKKGMSLEVALPARVLPRFPARDAMVLELCLSYEDADDAGRRPRRSPPASPGPLRPSCWRCRRAPSGHSGLAHRPRCRRWRAVGRLGGVQRPGGSEGGCWGTARSTSSRFA
jgi:hypothetical protein